MDGCPSSSSPEVVLVVGLDVDAVGFDDDDDPGAKKGTMGMNVVGRSEEETVGAGTGTAAVGTDVGLDVGLR